jgi:inosine-uridine nucleoside N-ribohydrolase
MTRKIILDTDPGVDDVVAMALAFMTPPNDTEIALITPVFGNTSLFHTVRNTVTTLNIIDQEREWREKNSYRQPRSDTPLVAMGAEGPIDGSKIIDARFFHGKDGIAEVHSSVRPILRAAIDGSTLTLRPRIMRGVRLCRIRHDISSHLRILHTSKY